MKNRSILKIHAYTGLIAGLFLLLMGLSGTILVFHHDIEHYSWETYRELDHATTFNIDKGIRSIRQQYPGWDTRLMHFEKDEALIFNLRRPTQRLFVFVHPETGEVIKELNELTTFTRWLLRFHYALQAGVPGRIIVFIIGLLFLLSLLSGCYVYRKSFFKTLFFRVPINRKNLRTHFSSLHRLVGVWSLVFNLLLVITGLFLSWTVVTASLKDPVWPGTPPVKTPVGNLLKNIETAAPDFTPTYIRFPATAGGSVVVYGIYEDDPFYYSEFGNYFAADPQTGKISSVVKIVEADLATKLSNTLIPLHFGNYGGIWTQVIYALVGLSGPFLSVSGFIIWYRGNKKKKQNRERRRKQLEKF